MQNFSIHHMGLPERRVSSDLLLAADIAYGLQSIHNPSFVHLLPTFSCVQSEKKSNMPLARDILHPDPEEEAQKNKLKRLVQGPNSYFMDVKCSGCYQITPIFSHAQTVVECAGCSQQLSQPQGGKARLMDGVSFRRKA